MSIYNTFVDFVGDGTTTDYALPFPYIDTTDVVVQVNGATLTADTDYTFPNPNTVRISPAPASGASVEVSRSTNISSARVVFANGSSTTAQQLNKSITQLLYGMQEAVDRASVGNAEADAAKAEADTALATANTANTTANTANTTADEADTKADTAISVATTASSAAVAAQLAAEAASAAATVHNAVDLPYDNTTSGLSATDVQSAIDLIAGAAGIVAITSSTINNLSSVTGAKVTDALNALKTLIDGLSLVATSGSYSDLSGTPALVPVATSGLYADLSGKPTLGTVAAKNISTPAAIWSDTGTDAITTDNAWASAEWQNLGNLSGPITLDCNQGVRFYGTLTGNVTVSFSNPKDGQVVELALKQDAVGGRTVSWAGNIAFPDAVVPAVQTAANQWAVFFAATHFAATAAWFGSGWKIS